MAFTLNTNCVLGNTAKEGGKTPWIADGYCADVSTAQELKAAPSSGNLYLEALSIDCETLATTETLTVYDAANIIFGPMQVGGFGGWEVSLLRPIKLAGALNIKTSAAAPIHCLAEGFTA